VQSLNVNGKPHTSTTIDSNLFKTGGTLEYVLADRPSAWGTGPNDGPPSLTTSKAVASPLADTTKNVTASSPAGEDLAALFDDTSATEVAFKTSNPSVVLTYGGGKQRPTFYTLTASGKPADPSAWILEGSNDGKNWTAVDTRRVQAFANRCETMPFKIQQPGAFQMFRLTVTAGAPTVALAEIELLSNGSQRP
jgi:hypothetical protein